MADVGGPLIGTLGDDFMMGDARDLSPNGVDNYSNSGTFALRGLAGNDIIAGDLYDAIGYDTEGDEIFGGSGNDRIYGDTAPDLSRFGIQSDWDGDPLWDTRSEGSSDKLYGDAGSDSIYGGGAGDFLYGGTGNDRLYGQAGVDWIEGNADQDSIFGGDGDDTVFGGTGADTINGGSGLDTLTGGGGRDIFVYTSIANSTLATPDVITDFVAAAIDRIDVSAIDAIAGGTNDSFTLVSGPFTGLGQVRVYVKDTKTYVDFNTQGGNGADMRIVLNGVIALDGDDFIL